ncbi:craniofacial development protein 2-like [Penaeus vannamei]|uniref:craniofacial development protein 2-like n=1 Tax=Penaeus vannamei TaxID=6689 RepID=UPI00387F7E3F
MYVNDVKEAFYAKLTSVIDNCPRRDIRIVLVDFGAVSGCDRAGYEMSVSPHGSGTDLRSENSLLLRDFARSQRMRISGSWYQRSSPHRWTWYSDTGIVAKDIDHILVSTRWRILQNCKVYRSVEFCGTDHELVVATLRVHSSNHSRVFHLNRLGDEECAHRFAAAISDRLTVLENLTDPGALWDSFNSETFDAAQESIGERPRTRQNFISLETLEATDACCMACLNGIPFLGAQA